MLREGIRTVLVGGPNAGKSSLLNRLVGRDRALVSPEPGTTRDFIEERVAIGPHGFRLIDTAGLNPTPGTVESLGMAKTRQCIEESDILIWVVDATSPTLPPPEYSPTLVVVNKIDLHSGAAIPNQSVPTVAVSALTGTGIDLLKETLVQTADGFQLEGAVDGIAINARHAESLERTRDALARRTYT